MFLLFGSYWIRTCFFENRRRHRCLQLILERNHVVFLAFLFSCQRTDLAKGPTDCQTLPSVSSGMFPCPAEAFCLAREPIPYDSDTGTHAGFGGWKDRTACCAGIEEFMSRPAACQDRVGNVDNSSPPVAIPTTARFVQRSRRLPPGLALTSDGACLFRASDAQLVVHPVVTVRLSESYFPVWDP